MISKSDILNGKILIVDEMQINIEILEKILGSAGYLSISSTLNPFKVCELLRKNHYHLIVLALDMQSLNGFQVMAMLKAAHVHDCPPILVNTTEPSHKEHALRSGAKDFITKPFERVEVLTRVHNMLEASLLLQEIVEHKEDNPALSNVIQRNIRKIIHIRQKATIEQGLQSRLANTMTNYSGSMLFFYVHIAWFLIWFF